MGKAKRHDKKPPPPFEPHKVAYFVYRDQVYPQMKEKYKSVNRGDMAELISNQWDSLDKHAKQQYQKKLDKIKGDYQVQKSQYEAKYGKIDPEQQRKRQLLETKRKEGIQKSNKSKNKKKKKGDKKNYKKQPQSQETDEQASENQQEEQQKFEHKKESKSKSTSKSKDKDTKPEKHVKKKTTSKNIRGKKKQADQNYRQMWVVDRHNNSQDQYDQ